VRGPPSLALSSRADFIVTGWDEAPSRKVYGCWVPLLGAELIFNECLLRLGWQAHWRDFEDLQFPRRTTSGS
jgi:hypothetical protein